jgi:hypothetical protein
MFCASCIAQQQMQLKSLNHGLKMMLSDVDKDTLIKEMRFENGNNGVVDVVRLDHVGPSLMPLIISEKMPVATDSLGILAIRLRKDSFDPFMKMINGVNPKLHTRKADGVLIRVTYRYLNKTSQYYVTDTLIVTQFLKMIESRLLNYNEKSALDAFYQFATRTDLVTGGVEGAAIWKY